ncbi:hypothetical protein [Roseimicrobium sp. ORNL1]|uniref:hypothetical protein n=1 Tax=Roseimicrobium sp. ORNL1 TaxID=2711231 RepID=UPI0013E1BF69|nr:hypothetical protein [Roseimicrobium sp. ORNL1]QIF02642.1 hypothetical protein G5S37_14275 [Roseimicrobium sp. ORNL1]
MEAFFDLFFLFLKLLLDAGGLMFQFACTLAEMATTPLRFVFSKDYRQRVLKDWDGNRARCLGDLVGGSLVLLGVAALLSWSATLLI